MEPSDSLSNVPQQADMLDLAQDVTDTSRLGCQASAVCLDKERDDGMRVRIPAGIVNLLK
ncbi:fdxB [Symbiodinium natans]|uniref:FdxB protein n=1 Tax=Symbiodinium natans TaxID=878477 RepID=A0A812PGH6_9DINO|nr:fdxB [Symbiodinium natans]